MTVLTLHRLDLTAQWSVQERGSRLTSPLMREGFCFRVLLSLQSFTVSAPLQRGIRLLRCFRPPVRTLAFSHPAEAGQASVEFPGSNAKDVIATFSCAARTPGG